MSAPTFEAFLYMLPVFGAGAGVWYRINLQINALQRELDAFKLTVAEKYATQHSIQQVEDRVVQAIERLGDRLDKFLDNRSSRNRA